MRLSLSEILKKTSSFPTKKERVGYLASHQQNTALRSLLLHVFHPNIKFLLPEGDPPYTPCNTGEAQGMLYTQIRTLYLFCEGGHPDLKQSKRERLFVQLLEAVDPDDAKLLLAVKDKKLPYKGIDINVVKEAMTDLL